MSTQLRKSGFATRQLHAGYSPEETTGSRAVPLYHTAAYNLQTTERSARLFALQESGNIYTRISNPTSNVLENRIADLEGRVAALEVSSGHAAQTTAIFTLCEAGDQIVSASTLYGGTVSQFKYTFPRLGIDVSLVDPPDPENYYPRNNRARNPQGRWRGHANLLYSNWLNYDVYQVTPFNPADIPGGGIHSDF
jgi:O-acetylhomoserine (thiol)-lyase